MSSFEIFFQLGLQHIIDVNGYDHILFIIALCAVFYWRHWKGVLVLVTAFTLGHSITLALATLNIISFSPSFIEFLIPVTIFVTAVSNIINRRSHDFSRLNYFYASVFGLIHGLGFSNYLQSLLGSEVNIVGQLFAFNLGLELGQIIIVAVFFLLSYIVIGVVGFRQKYWTITTSVLVMIISVYLIYNAKFW